MKTVALLPILLIVTFLCSTAIAADLDLTKSITIGSGKITVIEFTDPDCPFCRKASKYFDGRSDITRHVFFFPLAIHSRAKEKVRFILSMPDKAKAYHDVMSGRLDAAPPLVSTQAGTRLQEEQLEIAKKHRVDSTPTFMINGRIIVGFDLKKIEETLGK
ncbi:MAG: thioredoxin fold domain-containing protein [Desulfuromonadaceae bacterium]|nr:thioredoxin fold domain-containing protein [Desulfuromonadaceae bacterium]